MPPRKPPTVDFVIVGTPRSGTTLIQRLANEIPGVAVPPETHFFVHFYRDMIKRRHFPMSVDAVSKEIEEYLALDVVRGLDLDVRQVIRRCGSPCPSPVQLFAAIVAAMSDDAIILGEKTPDHLLWWKPLTNALPHLRVVAVMRDPRAVVASNLRVAWGMSSHVLLADRWRLDQRELAKAETSLGSDRFLKLKYEDAVIHPLIARQQIAQFLKLSPPSGPPVTGVSEAAIALPWESWKSNATGPISATQIEAWRDTLSESQIRSIETLCREEMRIEGYASRGSLGNRGKATLLSIPPTQQAKRVRMRVSRARRMRWVESRDLGRT